MTRVQWGILSTARINDKFIAGCAQSESVAVSAVASRDLHRARAYADEHAIERAYGSYEELLADQGVEAIYISLPNSMHLEWTERALRARKHVLCEKPLGRRASEVQAAFDLAEREDRLLMEGFMYRHNPQTRHLTGLVEAGAVGRLRMIRATFSFHVADETNVRLLSDLQGGALMDVGCYCVSAARLLAGEPQEVTAQQILGGDGVDVAFTGTMLFADRVLAHFDAGLALPGREELEVVGDEGALFLADPWHCYEPGIEVRQDGAREQIKLAPVDSYMLEAENLSAAIRGDAEPLLDRADALGQAATIEALYAAAAAPRSGVVSAVE